MATETRTCVDCQGSMSPIVIMDVAPGIGRRAVAGPLTYRLPDDKVSFWTGRYPTAGVVQAYMCTGCGRIALYGSKHDAETEEAADGAA